jgi:hypothetical protein
VRRGGGEDYNRRKGTGEKKELKELHVSGFLEFPKFLVFL